MRHPVLLVTVWWWIVLIAAGISPATPATLTVERATGRPGELVDLEVRIEDAPELGGFDVVLAYDPQVGDAVGALPGPALEDSLFRWSDPGPGRVLITAGDVPRLPEGEAVFAVTFQLYAPESQENPVVAEMARVYHRTTSEPLDLTIENGALIVRPGSPWWVWAGVGLLVILGVFGIRRVLRPRPRKQDRTTQRSRSSSRRKRRFARRETLHCKESS